MPVYEYMCARCGDFTAMRPMAEYEAPQPCPECESLAPRVLLTAPSLAGMGRDTRMAHETNERSRHAPMTNAEFKAKHRPGCSCCGTMKSRTKKKPEPAATAAKSFPNARPWMISH